MVAEVFFIAENETTLLKKALARTLYSKNFDQLNISKILNLSQPMVSIYCKSKDKIPCSITKHAEEISDKIIKGKKVNFQTCINFSDKSINGHFLIANKNEIITDENSLIIDNLKQAFYNIKEKELRGFIPEVKINLAMSKKNPKNSDDVASFLNGFIIVDDKITGYSSIKFGKSKHLSSILIKHSKNLASNAIMNIAYNKEIEKTNFKIGFLTKIFQLKEPGKDFDILIHKGDFGIEPCAYLLGKDAVDVTNKLLNLVGEK
jgi:XRE family transcriptional regulator, thiamine biosynthesis regulator